MIVNEDEAEAFRARVGDLEQATCSGLSGFINYCNDGNNLASIQILIVTFYGL